MPDINLDTFADAFPSAAALIAAGFIGVAVGSVATAWSIGKRIEQKLTTVIAIVDEALCSLHVAEEDHTGDFTDEELAHVDSRYKGRF